MDVGVLPLPRTRGATGCPVAWRRLLQLRPHWQRCRLSNGPNGRRTLAILGGFGKRTLVGKL
eukprot:5131609-Lingulodinium_polyedra.AAC.1